MTHNKQKSHNYWLDRACVGLIAFYGILLLVGLLGTRADAAEPKKPTKLTAQVFLRSDVPSQNGTFCNGAVVASAGAAGAA